ncbi:MAG TPA: D-alanine--D-alanine ligase [Clostridiales bacterium]|nr:D-alanine--D-alanine ligase [Clostridiales bacterium]
MIKLGVIYGGKSTENEVSIKSAKSVIENLDKNKYDIYPTYIDKNGEWYEDKESNKIKIENIIDYLKQFDVVFPVLHGLYGEDGTIQGMFELFGIKYVGCKVLASSVGMDKVYTKIVFDKAKINQTKYIYIKTDKSSNYIYVDEDFNEKNVELDDLALIAEKKLNYPMFVKPSNSGSSVGVNKAENREQLIKNIEIAAKFDRKILIEEGIKGKEVECAVLETKDGRIEVTNPGEIIPAGEYYSFDSKYNDKESKTLNNARITEEQKEEIKKLALKAFKAIDGSGLSRVDFFVENETGKIFINEINTMPGFTQISMYPKLFNEYGYTYSELLDKLINN